VNNMSYFTLKIENSDIVLDTNMRLETTEDISQSYKILLETQFESDSRDPNYGLCLQELFQTKYDNVSDLIELYVKETLMQHSMTNRIMSVSVSKFDIKKYRCDVKVLLKNNEELTIEGVSINV